jgi:hypothetical protein
MALYGRQGLEMAFCCTGTERMHIFGGDCGPKWFMLLPSMCESGKNVDCRWDKNTKSAAKYFLSSILLRLEICLSATIRQSWHSSKPFIFGCIVTCFLHIVR